MKKIIFLGSSLILAFLLMAQSSIAQDWDWANLNRYQKDDAKLEKKPQEQRQVVFMGNSITELWGNLSPDFFSEHSFVNRGISGQTTPQMLIRFRQDVIQLHPQLVLILAGTNDLAGNTGPATLKMIENNIASMADLARSHQIKVILCALLPAYDYPWRKGTYPSKKIVKLNKWIKNYCKENGLTFLDYYSDFVNEKGGMKAKFTKDGVHPNLSGYKVMEPLAMKTIHRVLKQ